MCDIVLQKRLKNTYQIGSNIYMYFPAIIINNLDQQTYFDR